MNFFQIFFKTKKAVQATAGREQQVHVVKKNESEDFAKTREYSSYTATFFIQRRLLKSHRLIARRTYSSIDRIRYTHQIESLKT